MGGGRLAQQTELVVDASEHSSGEAIVAGFHRFSLGEAVLLERFVARHAARAPAEHGRIPTYERTFGPRRRERKSFAVVLGGPHGVERYLTVAGEHEAAQRDGLELGHVVIEACRTGEIEGLGGVPR